MASPADESARSASRLARSSTPEGASASAGTRMRTSCKDRARGRAAMITMSFLGLGIVGVLAAELVT